MRGHMMPPLLHVRNGLAHPADESMLALDNRSDIRTPGHSDIIIACAAPSLQRHKADIQ